MQGEVPILDGSALEFCALLDEGGRRRAGRDGRRDRDRPSLRRRLGRSRAEKGIAHRAGGRLRGRTTRSTTRSRSGARSTTFASPDPEAFRREIAPARTFGFVKEIETLEQMGLASGGRLNNCILIGDEGVVNAPLRFPDEFVAPQDPRHHGRLLPARPSDPRPHRGAHDRARRQRRAAATSSAAARELIAFAHKTTCARESRCYTRGLPSAGGQLTMRRRTPRRQ